MASKDNNNLFIGDNFFKQNPSKVLGEQSIKKGQFGSDMIVVKGSIDNIQKIDAEPIKVVDLYSTSVQTFIPKDDAIAATFETEIEEHTKEKLKKLRGKKNKVNTDATQHIEAQEVYSYAEISKMYNEAISRDEMEAYYFTHEELNHKLLFDEYINSKEQLLDKGLICLEDGKYVYVYTYQSGNISKKISILNRDKEKIGESQYNKQLELLNAVRPRTKSFIGDEKIILLPHSNLAKEYNITELRFDKPKINGITSIFDAFKSWLWSIPQDYYKLSNSREIIKYYLDNETPPKAGQSDSVTEKKKKDRDAINIKQRTKEEGDELFAKFLAEELLPEDQAKLSYLWNEKFNSIAEPNLSKIPVCFRMAKYFKGRPLKLNPTQRQGVAFQMEKKSGLFAYGVGIGKAHLLTSDILTPTGFVKMRDIKVGDYVIGKNGKSTLVTGVYPQGLRKCYEFVFSDGSKTRVSDEHLWQVQTRHQRDYKSAHFNVLTTNEILKEGVFTHDNRYKFSIPMVEPIHFSEQQLIIDPYVMGCLIGDGGLSTVKNGGSISISNTEEDILSKISSLLPDSLELRQKKFDTISYGVTRKATTGENIFCTEIRELELGCKSEGKFIPHKYLFNTYENRLKLLQGLLDTDGYINKSQSKIDSGKKGARLEYTTVSKKLCQDIKFLIQTFGGTVIISTKMPKYTTHNGEKRIGQLAYTLNIRLPKGIIPVSSDKQLAKFEERTKYPPVRFIEEINDIGLHEAQCISVAAEDHLYVCEECIVTHNTLTAISCASQAYDNGYASKMLFVVPTNTYDKWLFDIQGGIDKETGKFVEGALPHLPTVIGLGNLNAEIVRKYLKNYSEEDAKVLLSIEDAIYFLKSIKEADILTDNQTIKLLDLYPHLSLSGLKYEYEQTLKTKSFPEYIAQYLKLELNYSIYELGTIKSFPEGTIFVTTEEGLQKLGVSEENKSELQSKLYEILSQGEKSADEKSNRDIAALENRISQTISSSMKNAKLYVEDFGFDWVCFDESHLYKKLFCYVSGQVTGEKDDYKGGVKQVREKKKYELKAGQYPSGRALSAFVLSHYIQSKNNNRNVIHLTATPFTNSPLEVFSMLTLTNYKALEEMGLSNMVDFFDTFMKINYDIKLTPQKTVVKDVVLTGYNNLSQLRQIIYSLMDKKDEGANLQRPNKIIYPSLQHGIETTIPMTAEQDELMSAVKSYISGYTDYDVICQSALEQEIQEQDFDYLEDEALIEEWERVTEKDYDGERFNLAQKERDRLISGIKNARVKGLEVSDEDMTKDESLGIKILRGISLMKQITLSPYLYYNACSKANKTEMALPNYKDFINSSPKFKYVLGCVKSVIDFHKNRDEKISGQVIYMSYGNRFFPLIKEYLIKEMGLKESEVGIIDGKVSKERKETIKKQFLNGEVLVLIGSATISVGVDLQNNATTLYNMTYDWNPTDAQQIEGRIWRQGNRFADVRIVYPMCFNSVDPVIFEYLNSKTLRINEIWNRSSSIQELDLRDFNPKELQKKLITDPEELAQWEILEEMDKVENSIMYFENRKGNLEKSILAYREYQRLKPTVIDYLNKLTTKKYEIVKSEAIKNQKEKINEIVEKYSDNAEKMAAEITKYKESRYDYENDPENKYVLQDYNNIPAHEIYTDCAKWAKVIEDWGWGASETWGKELTDNDYNIKKDLIAFRGYFKEVSASEEKILKPLGLSFETAANPVNELAEKIEGLKQELVSIEESKAQRIITLKEQFASKIHEIKTVQDRANEFASANEKYIRVKFIEEPKKEDNLSKDSFTEKQNESADEILKDIESPVIMSESNDIDEYKMSFIKSAKNSDYKLYATYFRLDEALEVIRGHYMLPIAKEPKPINIEGVDGIFAQSDGNILVDYKILENNGKFDLYDLTMEAFNRYEQGYGESEIKPITQLSTGSNVYFESENGKYRVNDYNGKYLLIIHNNIENDPFPISNVEFEDLNEAVSVAEKLERIYPNGVPDAVLIDRVVEELKNINKSIINSEYDLQGLSKEVWMNTKDEIIEKFNGQSKSVIENAIKSWRQKVEKALSTINVKWEGQDSKFIQYINSGKMTANDAKIIIESAGLEVPEEILDLALKYNYINKNTNFENYGKEESATEQIFIGKTEEEYNKYLNDATSVTRRIHKKGDESETGYVGDKVESEALEIYAKDNGIWVEDFDNMYKDKTPLSGVESLVYLMDDGKNVIKLNNGIQHSTWEDFFNRIIAYNKYFPETKYYLVGFTKHNGKLAVILMQKAVKINRSADIKEIENYLNKVGIKFNGINYAIDEYNGVIFRDLHKENVVIDDFGDILFIDPILQFKDDSLLIKEINKEILNPIIEKIDDEQIAEIKEAITILESLGDEADDEAKEALKILKTLI